MKNGGPRRQAYYQSLSITAESLHKFKGLNKKQNYMSKLLSSNLVSICLVICFIILRLWRLTAASLDGDEIFSLVLVRNGWHDLLANALQDATHPPLSYVLLKL